MNLSNNYNLSNSWNNTTFNNYFNNQNNITPFNHSNSAIINMNNNMNFFNNNNNNINSNTEITLKFAFTGAQVFMVKANLNEKVSEIIERFKNRQCPEDLINQLKHCFHSGLKIDKEKTLSELKIKNGDIILFIQEDNNEEEDRELTPEEREKIENLIKNLESLAYYLSLLSNANKNVKEHDHYLVYLITNFDWKCNLCNNNYIKNNPRYHCSLCDFNMCDQCYSNNKEYPKMKEFPSGIITPSNSSVNINYLDAAYHKHKLLFCRTSRNTKELNSWICDNCRQSFNNENWSFYCTNCDFDLCCSCCGYN
jgi:hypothetical protein